MIIIIDLQVGLCLINGGKIENSGPRRANVCKLVRGFKAGSHIIAAIVSIASIVCNLRDDRKRHKRLGAIRGFSYNRRDRLV